VSSIAPGDVPHPDIADARHEEIARTTPITYTLKNEADLDQIPWDEINCNPGLLRDVPNHWLQSTAEAKHAVVMALLTSIAASDVISRDRYWKLLGCVDAMLLSRPPRFRGGKKGQGAASLNRLLSGRLRSFWSGDWMQLWLEVETNATKTDRNPVVDSTTSEATMSKQIVNVIDQCLEHGAVSKALGRVSRPLRFASGDDVPARLQEMFPRPLGPAASQHPYVEASFALVIELADYIAKELRSLPAMCGAGANGAFFEHLKLHEHIHDGLGKLAEVLAHLVAGHAPPEAISCFRSGKAHPTLKPNSDVDIRPIVSPSAHWRAAMKGWSSMCKDDVLVGVGCAQYGCGRPGGAIALRHFVEAALLNDSELALGIVDVRNMHGSLGVDNIEEQVRVLLPRMWPLVAPWIRCSRTHVFKDSGGTTHRINTYGPLDQGGPESSPLACVAAVPYYTKLGACRAAYQDDGYFLLKPAEVPQWMADVEGALQAIGCTANYGKSGIWSRDPSWTAPSGYGIRRLTSMPLVMKQPMSVLAQSLDPSFAIASSTMVQSCILERTRLHARLKSLMQYGLSLQKVSCLFRTATAGDIVFLMQCHVLPAQLLEQFDAGLVTAHNDLVGISASEDLALGAARGRWFLPWRLGGFGLHSASISGPGLYMSAWLRDLSEVAETLGACSPSLFVQRSAPLSAALTTVNERLNHLGADFSDGFDAAVEENAKRLSRRWKDEAHSRIVTKLASEVSQDQNISLQEASGKGSGAWLNFPREPKHNFTDIEFRISIRLRMSLAVIQPSTHQYCRHYSAQGTLCGGQVDALGLHPLLCKVGGHVVHRHNAVRDELASILSSAEASAQGALVEQNAPDTPTANMRPDIVFHDFRGRVKHVDVEICTSHPRRMSGQYRPGALIEQLEGVKRRKYQHLPLLPFVVSHLGRFGAGAQGLLKLIFRNSDEQHRSSCITKAYQSIACVIQKYNVRLLSTANVLIGTTAVS
jgi:hypothetical protein